jgi:hypothetical protein
MAEMNKGINGAMARFEKMVEKLGKPPENPAPPAGEPPHDEPKPIPGFSPEANAEIEKLRKAQEKSAKILADREAKLDAAEKAKHESDRKMAFESAMNDVGEFPTARSKEIFKKAYFQDMKQDETGQYYFETPAGNMPTTEYLRNVYEEEVSFQPPGGHTGAGANNRGKNAPPNALLEDPTKFTTDDFMKMPKEKLERLSQHLAQQLMQH